VDGPAIGAAFPFQRRRARVLGRTMAFVDVGEGDPVVLLHGNPTSSYLWRNVLPHLQGLGRCVAPDLIGIGDSDKLPDSGPASYTFVEHRRYLDALLEALGVTERVTLVLHDWGSALAFDWANRHRAAVEGLAYLEALVRPFTCAEFDSPVRPIVEALRSPDGEPMVLEQNLFVERLLPGAMLRALGGEEMAEYRRPFAAPGEGRRPTLTWPRQIPFDGEPADVAASVGAYAAWLPQSDLPKLFVRGDPGTLTSGDLLEFCRSWRSQTEVTVRGVHYLQEDSPHEIGQAIADWLRTLT
jgi:haloalkane dehalogenase